MNRGKEIAKLRVLADLMLDHQLTHLKKAAEVKAHSEAALAMLSRTPVEAEGLGGAAGALAGLNYQRWADARRAAINQSLARQTHIWLEARDAARVAFGKADALRRLAEKLLK